MTAALMASRGVTPSVNTPWLCMRTAGERCPARVSTIPRPTLFALGGADFRLLVSEGEILDTDELPGLEMPYGFFRPDSGVRACADAWLRGGGPHHQVLNLGRRAAEWRLFGEAAGIEVVLV